MNARILIFFFLMFISSSVFSQDAEYKRTSIKTGIGLAVNEGKREIGVGLVYSVGFQKSYGEKNYFGGKGSLALRFDQKNKKLAYELRPINLYFGNNGFSLGSFMFGIDIKMNK